MRHISVPYINNVLDIEIPEGNFGFDVQPQAAPPVADIAQTLRDALQHPIGAFPLNKVLKPGQKILILVDDFTRLTPTRNILPILLDAINQAGVRDQDMSILIASGAHRAMSPAEIELKYGKAVLSRVAVSLHHYQDRGELIDYGRTSHGIPILVNRCIKAADFVIAVGHIIPHHPVGWSGGSKAVLPGIAGEETIAQFHLLGAESSKLGEINTVMRQEMEEAAERTGLDFILNVILNGSGEIAGAVAGHFVHAHRAGVALSRKINAVEIPDQADLTISSTAPIDHDFFQGDKGIFTAGVATRPGGEIILLTGCIEGINPSRSELACLLGRLKNAQLMSEIQQGKVADMLTASEAIMINRANQLQQITIATGGLTPDQCQAMGFKHINPVNLNAYIHQRLNQNHDLKIGLLRQSTAIFPILANEMSC